MGDACGSMSPEGQAEAEGADPDQPCDGTNKQVDNAGTGPDGRAFLRQRGRACSGLGRTRR